MEILWLIWDKLSLVTLGILPGATFPPLTHHSQKFGGPEASVGSVEGEARARRGALPFRKRGQRTPGVDCQPPQAPPAGNRGEGMPHGSQGNSRRAGRFPFFLDWGVHAVSWEWVINQPKGDRQSRLEHNIFFINIVLMARIRDPVRLLKDLKSENLL